MTKLLLFDIDGTMLRTRGAGSRAFLRAAEDVLGEGVRGAELLPGGALDPLLFAGLAERCQREVTDAMHTRFRAAYHDALAFELDRAPDVIQAMPGVHALLATLRSGVHGILGMLTGNYAETGRLKLARVGIDADWFAPVVWGDAADSRPGLVRHALTLMPEVAPEDVIVIGDTPRDVHCALENGARCLAVATGFHPIAELEAAGATRAVADLSDPTPLFELIAG